MSHWVGRATSSSEATLYDAPESGLLVDPRPRPLALAEMRASRSAPPRARSGRIPIVGDVHVKLSLLPLVVAMRSRVSARVRTGHIGIPAITGWVKSRPVVSLRRQPVGFLPARGTAVFASRSPKAQDGRAPTV